MTTMRAVDVRPLGIDADREFRRAGKEIHRWRVLFNAVVGEVDSLRRARRLSQQFAATRAHHRHAQLAEVGVSSVDELVLRLHDALAELRGWEEREAACCPEDVGFAEYIGVLEKRLERKDRRDA